MRNRESGLQLARKHDPSGVDGSRGDSTALAHAKNNRRAHGGQPANVGARAFRIPRRFFARRKDPAGEQREYARLGARLTYMAFIASAVIDAIRHHPIINASLDGENVIYKKNVHLGIAVALEVG